MSKRYLFHGPTTWIESGWIYLGRAEKTTTWQGIIDTKMSPRNYAKLHLLLHAPTCRPVLLRLTTNTRNQHIPRILIKFSNGTKLHIRRNCQEKSVAMRPNVLLGTRKFDEWREWLMCFSQHQLHREGWRWRLTKGERWRRHSKEERSHVLR